MSAIVTITSIPFLFLKKKKKRHYFLILFLRVYTRVILWVGMCTGVQVTVARRECLTPGVAVTGDREVPDMGAGALKEHQALSTAEPSLENPLSFCAWENLKDPCPLEVVRAR